MQYFIGNAIYRDNAGRMKADTNVSITVTDPDSGATLSIFESDRTTSLANPFTADADGYFEFWCRQERATVAISGDNASRTLTNIDLSREGEITPQMFGAAGDGTTDDGPAFRLAVAALNASSGGVLYIPAGTYYIGTSDSGFTPNTTMYDAPTAFVLASDNIKVTGAGKEVTTITTDQPISIFTDVHSSARYTDISYSGLTIKYTGGFKQNATGVTAAFKTRAKRCHISDCRVIDFRHVVHLWFTHQIKIHDIDMEWSYGCAAMPFSYDTDGAGVFAYPQTGVQGWCHDIEVYGVRFNGGDSADYASLSLPALTNIGHIKNPRHGAFLLTGTGTMDIHHNKIRNFSVEGIMVEEQNNSTYYSMSDVNPSSNSFDTTDTTRRADIHHNEIDGVNRRYSPWTTQGIVAKRENAFICNNTVRKCTIGITVNAYSSNNVSNPFYGQILDNVVTDCLESYWLFETDGLLFDGNKSQATATWTSTELGLTSYAGSAIKGGDNFNYIIQNNNLQGVDWDVADIAEGALSGAHLAAATTFNLDFDPIAAGIAANDYIIIDRVQSSQRGFSAPVSSLTTSSVTVPTAWTTAWPAFSGGELVQFTGHPYTSRAGIALNVGGGGIIRDNIIRNFPYPAYDLQPAGKDTIADGNTLAHCGVKLHLTGMGGAYQVNNVGGYPIGTTVLAVDNSVGSLYPGDAVQIGNYKYAVEEINNGRTQLTLRWGLIAAVADNDPITLVARDPLFDLYPVTGGVEYRPRKQYITRRVQVSWGLCVAGLFTFSAGVTWAESDLECSFSWNWYGTPAIAHPVCEGSALPGLGAVYLSVYNPSTLSNITLNNMDVIITMERQDPSEEY